MQGTRRWSPCLPVDVVLDAEHQTAERDLVGRPTVDVAGQSSQARTVGDRDEDGGVIKAIEPFEEGNNSGARPFGLAHTDPSHTEPSAANTSAANTSISADE